MAAFPRFYAKGIHFLFAAPYNCPMTNQHTDKRRPHICACGDHGWVALTKGFVTLFDPADAAFVGNWSWSALYIPGRKPRAVRRQNGDGRMRYLHRELIGASIEAMSDHRSGDTLDNRRVNLRECSSLENNWNAGRKSSSPTSRYKGVTFSKAVGKWTAEIRAGTRYRLGYFVDELAAAVAYDAKAVELHGDFARTNKSLGLLPEHVEVFDPALNVDKGDNPTSAAG